MIRKKSEMPAGYTAGMFAPYREAIAELRPLLGMSHDQDLRLNQSLNSVIATLKNTVRYTVPGQLNRADVAAVRVNQQSAKVNQQLARSEAVEDWEVATGYEAACSVDEPVGVERERVVGVGLKIPLPIRVNGQGRIAALCRVDETIESLEGRVLPLLKTREKKTRQAFEEGLINFNQVILLRQQQSRTGEALIHAKTDQAQALSKLQNALGSHARLKPFEPSNVKPYKPGTEPKDAPFALPAMRVKLETNKIQAVHVNPPKQKPDRKPLFRGFMNRISKPKNRC